MLMPHLNLDEPVGAKRKSRFIGELKIEDCKLNICGCRSRSAGAPAATALARRVRRVSLGSF
jgi:hypothetical protein